MPQKFFLVDGSALYYRSYFVFMRNPLINSKGENTSATFGFLSAMIKLIEEEKPDYLAIIFDTKEPTFRHEIYSEYKATREKMPPEMAEQYPRLVDTLTKFNFKLLDKAGYEADDIIGTLADKYASEDLHVFIVSGDKDMAQLVNDHVFLYNPGRSNQNAEVLDREGVRDKMGVRPEQIIDWLSLMGDQSDNIPGIPKVGKKTAEKFLREFGSLENLYDNIDALKESAVKKNLIEYKDNTGLARKLTRIDTLVPIKISLDELEFRMWDMEVAGRVLNELEFRRLFNRVQSVAQKFGVIQDFDKHAESQADYRLVSDMDALKDLLADLKKQKAFVFDLETSAIDFNEAQLAGIAVSWQENTAYYIAVNHPDVSMKEAGVLELIRPLFADENIRKIGQNIKFDAMILKNHGLEIRGIYFDTMIASYLINPTGQHNLDKLSERYLNYEMIHIEELIGSGKKQKKMTDIPASAVVKYAAEDADITLKLYNILKPLIAERGMDTLFFDLEMPLVEVLMAMEMQGVKLDTDLLRTQSELLAEELQKLEASIYEAAGEMFNLNSPQQLGKILFDKLAIHQDLGLKRPPKTKTGQYSTTEAIMERFIGHPIVENIMTFRKLTKLKNTYLDALPGLVSPATGKVHTSYNQTVAATGRLSSSSPNLQNIPIRTDIGRDIRKAFVASKENYKILSADYSQIELRIMAHLSGDEAMIESFRKNQDIHASTAALIFGTDVNEVDAEQRRKAKAINFGIIYGMSKYGLASRLNISVDEAEEFIADYMATYRGVYQFMQNAMRRAAENGFVETMMHRRRYLPEIKSDNRQIREFAERTAINTPIQGSAADLIKKAMIDIHRFLINKKGSAKMLMQVHDELIFEVDRKEAKAFAGKVKELMENAIELSVPLVADIGIGDSWYEAH